MRGLRDAGKTGLRWIFETGQRFGVDILPRHFYSSVPDIRALRAATAWRRPLEMTGVAGADIVNQVAYFEQICPVSQREEWARRNVHAVAARENGQGGGYGVIEADVLYAFSAKEKPRRVVQIGCGVSTAIILRAAADAGYQVEIICIEPFPSDFLNAAHAAGRIRLVAEGAQSCARDVLADLKSGDLLFIDSTHAVHPASEVNRIILDVLPRLGSGVFVHFHDIYFPYDYQRSMLSEELFFSAESSLLHAFLIGNARYRMLLSLSMLHYGAPQAIGAALPHYEPQANDDGLRGRGGIHFPSATYLVTV